MSREKIMLPVRVGETDKEKRLREALNRLGGQVVGAIDAAIEMRTAPQEAQRARHMARGAILEALLLGMHALAVRYQEPEGE